MPAISVLMKPASGMCNMHCEYCFYADEMNERETGNFGFMSLNTLKNIIRKALFYADHNCSFAYQGGEPSLRGLNFFKKAVEYQKQYNHKKVRIVNAFQTNGILLNENWCQFFKENHFLVGVSVDGTEELHNKYRHLKDQSDSYQRIVSNIELLKKHNVDFNILTVINNDVSENAGKIYDHYKEMGWMYQQYIPCLSPLQNPDKEDPFALTAENYGIFLTEMFEKWMADLESGKQPYNRQFENWIGILLGFLPESCDMRGTCGVQYVVEADGSAYPCDFFMLDDYRIGNFNDDSIEEMNKKRREIEFIEISQKHSEKCKSCQWNYLCRNGCQRMRLPDGSSGFYINRFCEGYQYFFDHCAEKMKALAMQIKSNRR